MSSGGIILGSGVTGAELIPGSVSVSGNPGIQLGGSGTNTCCCACPCQYCPDVTPATYTMTLAGVVLRPPCSSCTGDPGNYYTITGSPNGTFTLRRGPGCCCAWLYVECPATTVQLYVSTLPDCSDAVLSNQCFGITLSRVNIFGGIWLLCVNFGNGTVDSCGGFSAGVQMFYGTNNNANCADPITIPFGASLPCSASCLMQASGGIATITTP